MLPRKSDFDLTDPVVVVRLMAGLFYVPHVLFKLNGIPGSLAFFGRAGFNPPGFWLTLAIAMEIACAVGLTLNIQTKWLGLVSAGVMGFAAYAVFATKGVAWMWNMGGVEYLTFWGVASAALAVHAWKQEWSANHRLSLFGRAEPHPA